MQKNLLKIIVILGVLIILTIFGVYYFTRTPKISYQYDEVEQGKIAEEVKADGQVKTAENVDLSFQVSGKIKEAKVQVGDKVKTGQILLTLDNADYAAQLAQAQANLNQKLAGPSEAEANIYKAAAEIAMADLEKSKTDTVGNINAAQAALDIAQNNLKLADGGQNSQIINNAYENSITVLNASLPILENGLTQADNIIGVDNSAANYSFKNVLSVLDDSKLTNAKNQYLISKVQVDKLKNTINNLNGADHINIDLALSETKDVFSSVNKLLDYVSEVLNATVTSADLNQVSLDLKKTTIENTRSASVAQSGAIINRQQTNSDAKNIYSNYKIAYDKALSDYNNVVAAAKNVIALKQATYDQAMANWQAKTQAPREVDLAALRAMVSQAEANYAKTILLSPIDGVIAKQDGKVGAMQSPGTPLVSVISDNQYQVEIFVAESDISKIVVGNEAAITLDNLGNAIEFAGKVIKIDPAGQAQANGSMAYKVTLQFNQEDARIKVGLTANVKIITATKDNVLTINRNDVIQKNEKYYVLVAQDNAQPQERKITIGLKSADGRWEVVSGLQTGERVVSFNK
ncbi:MAG: efflux RND transporter periplasmic adaptor subunit [Patescibacteria group bacterium]|nr:efflux RND transporter periplasmic adaptor subunit [Patescibacteria group bacterium]